jgi:hypothetical protein
LDLSNGLGSATITGTGNGATSSDILRYDLLFRNGVMHLVDEVLLP